MCYTKPSDNVDIGQLVFKRMRRMRGTNEENLINFINNSESDSIKIFTLI